MPEAGEDFEKRVTRVYRPITATCALREGINHFLTLGFNDRFLLPEGVLPNRYFIQLPGLSFLFSVSDLTGVPGYEDLIDLRLHSVFDAHGSNTQLLDLFAPLLNEGVQFTKNDQTARNLWREFIDAIDRRLYPNRMAYRSRVHDRTLLDWQHIHCPPHA